MDMRIESELCSTVRALDDVGLKRHRSGGLQTAQGRVQIQLFNTLQRLHNGIGMAAIPALKRMRAHRIVENCTALPTRESRCRQGGRCGLTYCPPGFFGPRFHGAIKPDLTVVVMLGVERKIRTKR